MKVKTSITLSQDVLRALARFIPKANNRSEVIEKALWSYLKALERRARNAKDLAILNRQVKRLNDEAEDSLDYQVDL